MSGDCDLCGSYDHVETKCDAYEDPVIGPCPCGHDPACGYASVTLNGETTWLCHDDDHSCYVQHIRTAEALRQFYEVSTSANPHDRWIR